MKLFKVKVTTNEFGKFEKEWYIGFKQGDGINVFDDTEVVLWLTDEQYKIIEEMVAIPKSQYDKMNEPNREGESVSKPSNEPQQFEELMIKQDKLYHAKNAIKSMAELIEL